MLLAIPNEETLGSSSCADEKISFSNSFEYSLIEILEFFTLKYVKKNDSILVLIGNFVASATNVNQINKKLVAAGHENALFLSEDEKLVKALKKKTNKKGRKINMTLGSPLTMPDDTINVILDICSLQSVLSNKPSQLIETLCSEIFSNVSMVLKGGGRYLCLMDPEEILVDTIIAHFKESYFIRMQCFQLSANSVERSMKVFAPSALFTFTKLKMKLPKPVLEVATKTEKAGRVDEEEFMKEIASVRGFSYLQYKLRTELNMVTAYAVDLWNPETNSESPRYTVHLVDSSKDNLGNYAGSYGVFIVPLGRELSWLFASDKGRRHLASMAGFERLAITSTHRGHSYGNLSEIQLELSSKVMQFAPPGLHAMAKVPFVTVGNDVGQRDIIFENGDANNGFVVEDVKMDDGYFYRRLVFKRSPATVQSEFRILKGAVGNDGRRKMDPLHLVFYFHRRMIAVLSYISGINTKSDLKILLIGLGGGALPKFIENAFKNATVTCVELDAGVVDLAKQWFDFEDDSRVQTVIADGLNFMRSEIEMGKDGVYDAIIFDVNTDDDSMAIIGPPMTFLEASVIENVKSLLKPSGVFMFNLVCRDCDLQRSIIQSLKDQLGSIRLLTGEEDELNIIVMCLSPRRQEEEPSSAECMEFLSQLTVDVYGNPTSQTDPLDFKTVIENIREA